MKDKNVRAAIDARLAGMEPNEGKLAKRAYGRSQFRIDEEPGTVG